MAMACAAVVRAQAPTTAEMLASLAVTCVPSHGADEMVLRSPSRLPFLGSAVFEHLESRGITVLAERREGIPELTLGLERAAVAYERAGSGRIQREASLAMSVRLLSGQGTVLEESVCARDARDIVPREDVEALEESAYPETRGEIPLSRWRRVIQPAVVAAATAAGTVLFFSLRSRRTDGS